VLAQSYEIQWDAGTGAWQTPTVISPSARPTSFITQEIDQFAHLVRILAQVGTASTYRFRMRSTNAAGTSDWSAVASVNA
ncbi:MAG TPA: hypothetical protein PLA44_13495, partial [Propionibacteriaceae bacterium]|nr:hypothetical protein [Propionibacteriaceae bacterium]